MEVAVGYTLGGMLGGAAIGGIVWLTDPGGPTSVGVNVRDGAVLGTLIGAIAGYYLLFNSAIDPNVPPQPRDDFQDLLGKNTPSDAMPRPSPKTPFWDFKSRGVSLTLIHVKF